MIYETGKSERVMKASLCSLPSFLVTHIYLRTTAVDPAQPEQLGYSIMLHFTHQFHHCCMETCSAFTCEFCILYKLKHQLIIIMD